MLTIATNGYIEPYISNKIFVHCIELFMQDYKERHLEQTGQKNQHVILEHPVR